MKDYTIVANNENKTKITFSYDHGLPFKHSIQPEIEYGDWKKHPEKALIKVNLDEEEFNLFKNKQKILGTSGAIIATIGVTLPSFLIIWSLYPFLTKSFQNDSINKIYLGVQAGVITLILNSAINLFKNSVKSKFSKLIFLVALSGLVLFKINPILIILFGFSAGYVSLLLERRL